MTLDMGRRRLLVGSIAAGAGGLLASRIAVAVTPASGPLAELMAIEARSGGRLGVAILDLATGRRINHRGEERFALCSTFKMLLAAMVLARVDRGEEQLDRRLVFEPDELVSYSPVTETRTGSPGMTIAELCEAAVTTSDNSAANLLLATVGGPPALTAFARSIGDQSTRLDRLEPELNFVEPGDPRDTTTPAAMLVSMRGLLVEDSLSEVSRKRLVDWLIATRTGAKRLRAGVPADWRVGDKTGTNGSGAVNDIAVMYPPGRAPLLVAAYYDAPDVDPAVRESVLAEVGAVVASLVPAAAS